MRRLIQRLLSVLIVLIPLAVLSVITIDIGPSIMAYAAGRHGTCTLPETIESGRATRRQETGLDYLKSASSRVRTDADGTALWRTPDGPWWVPARSADAVLYDLAEQDRDIYRTGEDGIRQGDIVLDCGANVGVFTKKALLRGAAHVI